MARTQQEIVRAQLVTTGADWDRAVRQLRELLLGLASEMDALDERLKKLEAESRKA
jgi:hypothetical protein